MVDLYFLLYAFLNFLKSSIRPNIIWAIISNDIKIKRKKFLSTKERKLSEKSQPFSISED